MSNSTDHNQTVDLPATPADSLEAGLAAGFGKRMESPRSTLGNSQRPMLLRDAEGESAHVVKPRSDAMPSAAQVGDRYQLSGEIARGGMGAVLRGRDVDLGRDLAIKVLLEQYADRPEIARRFIEEAQIGGQLQHPGVVPVYDIGHFGDRPFFTMKLVKGQTLAALLSERSDPTVERPRMLSIALQVAQTLAYAHAKGVIHRDLKPANIMVGSFGEVQVMDWGLAKVLAEGGVADEAQASRQYQLREDVTTIRTARSTGSSGSFGTETEAGSLLGTPAYMPPEQANGDVALLDRRADVFGLGAILCEILTGKPPYVGRNSEEVRRKAANGDLADAMARLESCTAEQELISLTKQCLAAEAIDRPKDAQAVADGMTAYLDRVQDRLHQAELAEAAAQVQAKEEIKRRRLTMALAGSIFLLLGVGGGSLWWMDRQAEQRRTEVAIQLANKEAEKKHRQEVTEREVLTALESLHLLINEARKQDDNASKMRLTLLTAKAHAERAEAAVTQGDVSEGVQAKVTAANALLKQANKDHNLLMMLERIRLERGENTSFSSSADAQPVTSTSSAPATKQQSRQLDDSNLRVNSSYRSAFQQYGWDLLKTPAKEIASQIEKHPHKTRILIAIASWTNQADDEDGDRLAHILDAVEEPADSFRGRLRAGLRDQTGKKLVELATKPETLDQPPANIEFLAEQLAVRQHKNNAVDLLRKGVDRYPGDFWLHTDLGTRLIVEGKSSPDKLAEASRHLTAAIALRPDSPSAAMHLGMVYADLEHYSTAMQWYHRCMAGNPSDPYVHNNIGVVLTRKKQYAEAMPWLQKAVELDPATGIFSRNLYQFSKHTLSAEGRVDLFRQLAQKHPGSASLQLYYGVACQEANQPTEAEKHYVKALDLSDLYAAFELANHRYWAKDYSLAARFYQLAVKQNPRSIILNVNLAQSYSEQGKYDDAVVVLEKLIERAPQYATPHNYLAALYLDKKKLPEKVIEHAQLAIKLDPHDSWSQNLLGCGLRDSGRTDEAIAQFIKTTSIDKTNVMPYRNLFDIYIKRKQFDLAKAAYENLVKIDPADTVQRNEYGRLLRYAGRYDDAVEVLQSIIKTDPSYPPLHLNLGFIFMARKEFAKADEAFKEGMRREPDNARWPYEYGLALRDAGRLDDAAKAFEQALRLNPTDKQSLVELGYICYKQGNFKAAQDYYQQRLQHDQQNNGIKTMLARLKRLVPLEAKLPAVLDGSVPVSDFQIKADLSLWCYLAGRYRKAIQLFTEIEIADRSVVEGLDDWLRYNAACAAILASTGQGIDAKPLDALEARKLRKQTLDWLNTDLALYQKRFESGKTEDRVFIQGRMRHWQQDADFVTIRGKDALSKLQADEREAFSKLWIDVESLLQKVQLRPK